MIGLILSKVSPKAMHLAHTVWTFHRNSFTKCLIYLFFLTVSSERHNKIQCYLTGFCLNSQDVKEMGKYLSSLDSRKRFVFLEKPIRVY